MKEEMDFPRKNGTFTLTTLQEGRNAVGDRSVHTVNSRYDMNDCTNKCKDITQVETKKSEIHLDHITKNHNIFNTKKTGTQHFFLTSYLLPQD